MANIFILIRDEFGKEYFLDYSTISDSFCCKGLSEEKFLEYCINKYGNSSISTIKDKIEQCYKKGTSGYYDNNVSDTLCINRAGKNESYLTLYEIIEYYCKKQCKSKMPIGLKK